MIYFALDKAAGTIKIGYSATPPSRLSNLQVGNSNELVILGTIEGERDKEKVIHGELDEHHVRGDWFRTNPDIARYINAILENGGSITDPVELMAYAELISMLKKDGPDAFSMRVSNVDAIQCVISSVAAITGKSGMRRVYEAVEDYAIQNHPDEANAISKYLDKRFDGIGGWWS